MSKQRANLIKELTRLRPELDKEFGIEIFGIVGSWARDEATDKSDIDIAYKAIAGRKVSLIHLGGAWTRLQETLGQDIDLVDWDAVDKRYKAEMQNDLVRFYG